jgi:ribosomal protein S18 acetylase RimI-like enzyme
MENCPRRERAGSGTASEQSIVKFRQARLGDVERLALLHADSWRRTYRGMMADAFLDGDVVSNRLQVWRDRLASARPDQFILLADDGARLAGFVCAFGAEDPTWGSYIDNLHVANEYQRKGIGESLMRDAARWLSSRYPESGVYLWVMQANHRARRFYERLGATNAGMIDKQDPGGGSAPNCRYVWPNPGAVAAAR